MRQSLSTLIPLLLISAALFGTSIQQPDHRLMDLQKEQDKLKRTTDPVDRAKEDIKISEILVSLISDAVKKGDLQTMRQRLTEYVSTIQEAHDGLVKSDRDARKKPHGFKELEISLRRQIKQLEDIGLALTFDEREPIDNARKEASQIRDDLLKALFGSPNGSKNTLQ